LGQLVPPHFCPTLVLEETFGYRHEKADLKEATALPSAVWWWMKDETKPPLGISALFVLQSFDTAGSVTRRTYGP